MILEARSVRNNRTILSVMSDYSGQRSAAASGKYGGGGKGDMLRTTLKFHEIPGGYIASKTIFPFFL